MYSLSPPLVMSMLVVYSLKNKSLRCFYIVERFDFVASLKRKGCEAYFFVLVRVVVRYEIR